jgi:hypothetical protein
MRLHGTRFSSSTGTRPRPGSRGPGAVFSVCCFRKPEPVAVTVAPRRSRRGGGAGRVGHARRAGTEGYGGRQARQAEPANRRCAAPPCRGKIKNPTTPFHSPALPGGSVRPAGGFARTRGPSRPRRTLPCFPTRALHQPRASPCPPRRPPPYIPSGLHPPPQLISPHQVLLLLPPVLRPPEAAAQQAKPLPRPRYS